MRLIDIACATSNRFVIGASSITRHAKEIEKEKKKNGVKEEKKG